MRIGFNARLLSAPTVRGWNRYAINLLMELAQRDVDLVLYSDRPLDDAHRSRLPDTVETRVASGMRYIIWEQRWLPQACSRDGIQLFHSPFHFGLPLHGPFGRVLTVHDAIGTAYREPRRTARPKDLPIALSTWLARRRAHRVITPSEHARRDIVRWFHIPDNRIRVIPEAADPRFANPPSEEECRGVIDRFDLARPYVLYVGGWEERKNLPALVRGFELANLPDVDLVLAGGTGSDRERIANLVARSATGSRIRLLEWVPDDLLPLLYAGALCFVYPSRYEGFGLQLCEAMAVGCPTLASKATSLPEVLGDGGETFDPDDPQALADLLRRVATDTSFRASLSDRARRRSSAFSWASTADRTLAVYRELVNA